MRRPTGGSVLGALLSPRECRSAELHHRKWGPHPLTSRAGSERCQSADVERRRLCRERVVTEVGKASGPGLGPSHSSPVVCWDTFAIEHLLFSAHSLWPSGFSLQLFGYRVVSSPLRPLEGLPSSFVYIHVNHLPTFTCLVPLLKSMYSECYV